jgi:hypothetical protein
MTITARSLSSADVHHIAVANILLRLIVKIKLVALRSK